MSRNQKIIFSFIILYIGIIIFASEYFNSKKIQAYDYVNQLYYNEIVELGTDIEEVDERFHARFNAIEKTYMYRIHTSTIPNVFERKYVYNYTENLNIEAMKEAAKFFLGTHDYRAFCGNKKMKKAHTLETVKAKMDKIW